MGIEGQVPGMPKVSPLDSVRNTEKSQPVTERRLKSDADQFRNNIAILQQKKTDFADSMSSEDIQLLDKLISRYQEVIGLLESPL